MGDNFLRRAGRLVRRLGIPSGTRAAYLLMRRRWTAETEARRITLSILPHPLWIRGSASDFEAFEQIFVHDEYDFSRWAAHHAEIERAYAKMLERGKAPVIIDCGANTGYASIWFALRYPRATVYAIEPEPENFTILRRNVSPYANIIPLAAGVSDCVTRLSLVNPGGAAWACQTIEDDHGCVPSVTIPDLLARHPDAAPLIVKVDIEGYETSLFRSNAAWAAQTSLVVFEMHDWLFQWRGTGDAILRCLTQQPRDYLIRGETVFSFAHPGSRAE
jgi:FkbM family methyltransferase